MSNDKAWLDDAFAKFLADYADVLDKPMNDMMRSQLRMAFCSGAQTGVNQMHEKMTLRSMLSDVARIVRQ